MKRFVMTFVILGSTSVAFGQYPPSSGWGYYNRAEALRQAQWENQMRLRQQEAWERANPERSYVLESAEQATRIRANKAQERYYRNLNEQMEREPSRSANPFSHNPFSHNPFYR